MALAVRTPLAAVPNADALHVRVAIQLAVVLFRDRQRERDRQIVVEKPRQRIEHVVMRSDREREIFLVLERLHQIDALALVIGLGHRCGR
jgi:hypothetical protein